MYMYLINLKFKGYWLKATYEDILSKKSYTTTLFIATHIFGASENMGNSKGFLMASGVPRWSTGSTWVTPQTL